MGGWVRPNLKAYALVTNPKETDVFSTGFAVLSAKKFRIAIFIVRSPKKNLLGIW